jgi:ubiquinone/menaquinone biosynthesis C-methylase UbiE
MEPTDGPGSVEGYGAWYDAKQGDRGDLWHRTLIDPALLDAVGVVPRGARLLDVGCGNGYLARAFARRGLEVTGVERSSELVALARASEEREPLGVTYREGDAANLAGLEDASFELAIANMSLMDIEDAHSAIREVGRVTRSGGRFVFSISHPCFDVDTRSAYVVERTPDGEATIFRKVAGYRKLHSDRYLWGPDDGSVAVTVGFHRPLSWYAHELRGSGWVLVDLHEPAPLAGFGSRRVEPAWVEAIPLHLVVEARREDR